LEGSEYGEANDTVGSMFDTAKMGVDDYEFFGGDDASKALAK